MNMITKRYQCSAPQCSNPDYEVYAWQAMGSLSVNYRLKDSTGWIGGVWAERLNQDANIGILTMDELINAMYFVKA